jgi:large subunit ribosomal protein L35Ae
VRSPHLLSCRLALSLSLFLLCRAKRNQVSHTVLLKLQGVQEKGEVDFYLGKRVCYIYKAKTEKNGSKFRTIWGRVTGPHGGNGGVKAKFATNLPPKALGGPIRVMLYPSRV